MHTHTSTNSRIHRPYVCCVCCILEYVSQENALAAHTRSSLENWQSKLKCNIYTIHQPVLQFGRIHYAFLSFCFVLFCFISNKSPLWWKYSKWSSKLLHFVRRMKSKMRKWKTDRNGSSTAATNYNAMLWHIGHNEMSEWNFDPKFGPNLCGFVLCTE